MAARACRPLVAELRGGPAIVVPPLRPPTNGASVNVILNYGMGVDSSTILHLLLTDPARRDFDLPELVVISAQTGNEFPDTKGAVEKFMLPLLRKNKVRYVQVARRGPLRE